jgi:hypothetical protein
MKVLVACEESQEVCIAFRERGHEAYSNDLIECSGGHPEWHMQMDCMKALSFHTNERLRGVSSYWDLVIFFPPCTHLAVSGARWFKDKIKEQQEAITFFKWLTCYRGKWAIENPIGIMSTHYRKPDQIIQPWQFGHGETKATCLWLNGLPKLQPTDIVEGREQRIWKMAPSPDRAKNRSKTFTGIAKAMAEQWG